MGAQVGLQRSWQLSAGGNVCPTCFHAAAVNALPASRLGWGQPASTRMLSKLHSLWADIDCSWDSWSSLLVTAHLACRLHSSSQVCRKNMLEPAGAVCVKAAHE